MVMESVTTCLASRGNFSGAMMSSLMCNLGLTLVSVVKDNVKKYLVYSSSLLMITQPPRLEDTTNICADWYTNQHGMNVNACCSPNHPVVRIIAFKDRHNS